MKIGILGGTFDPIHWGHLFMAEEARVAVDLDMVYFAPVKVPPHKSIALARANDRLTMIELSIADNPKFAIGLWDYESHGPAYTYQSVKKLKEMFFDDELFFIVGGDSLRDFGTWKNPEEIIKYCKVIGLKRPGADFQQSDFIRQNKERFIIVDSPQIEISSTGIREKIKNGQEARYYLHPAAYDYIKAVGLYR